MSPSSLPGLYVHVPLCRRKCRYCGFYSLPRPELEPRWLASVALEATRARDGWPRFDTLYLGGGTPSLLSTASLAELMRLLAERFDLGTVAETTIEVNPRDVTPTKAAELRALGFDRVSVGVQSFRDDELRWLGRRHDARQAVAALENLRRAGFERIGIDLLLGLPHQTSADRLRSVEQALALAPEHLSCYELTVEPGTPLAREVAAEPPRWPDDDAAAEGFVAVSERLRSQGYRHYEVSNFARDEAAESRHNRKYWHHVPYLGLGPSAHSFSAGIRWANLSDLEQYAAALTRDAAPEAHRERLTPEQLRWERVALGLRTSRGAALDDLPLATADGRVEELVERGLARRRGGRLVPTVHGLLLADALARRLLFGDASVAT